jgi:hypothetical protein
MTTAMDKWPAAARLVAVAAAGHLPTAPTPPQGTRPPMTSRLIADQVPKRVTTLLQDHLARHRFSRDRVETVP